MKILRWLFTREERKFLPEMLTTICFAVGVSWVVCSFMLHERDLLWNSALYASQDIDFDIYETIQALHMELIDVEIQVLELELEMGGYNDKLIPKLEEPNSPMELYSLPGFNIREDSAHEMHRE
mgnify:CR=1 FL=1